MLLLQPKMELLENYRDVFPSYLAAKLSEKISDERMEPI